MSATSSFSVSTPTYLTHLIRRSRSRSRGTAVFNVISSLRNSHCLRPQSVTEVFFGNPYGATKRNSVFTSTRPFSPVMEWQDCTMAKEEQEIKRTSHSEGVESEGNDENGRIRKNKLKKRLLKEASEADNRGVCYLSRIPPHMDHVKLRHILFQYGEIQRIYLAPEDLATQVHR